MHISKHNIKINVRKLCPKEKSSSQSCNRSFAKISTREKLIKGQFVKFFTRNMQYLQTRKNLYKVNEKLGKQALENSEQITHFHYYFP